MEHAWTEKSTLPGGDFHPKEVSAGDLSPLITDEEK